MTEDRQQRAGETPRGAAARILMLWLEHRAFPDLEMERVRTGRPFVLETTYGTLRHLSELDWILGRLTRRLGRAPSTCGQPDAMTGARPLPSRVPVPPVRADGGTDDMRQPAPGGGPRSTGHTGDRSPRAVARRLLSRYRRPVAAALAGTAVLVTVAAVRPPDAVTVPVVVAGGDLPAGVPLAAADLRVVDVPRACAPVGAERDPGTLSDRVPITELRAGEAVTATRLVGGRDGSAPGAGAGAGLLAAPVRIADSDAVGRSSTARSKVRLHVVHSTTSPISFSGMIGMKKNVNHRRAERSR